MPSGNFNRIFRYLQAIEDGGGCASRMAFYNVAGNEENLRRWERKLCEEWRIVEKLEESDRSYYRMTELGSHLHSLLKNHHWVGDLFRDLVRNRLR